MPNQIIDINNTVIELEKKNLKIDDLGLLKYYIKNYNINTFLVEYSQFFIDEATDKFIDTSSNELIELYRFDKNFGNHLFRNILVLEKMINTNIAYNVINHYNLQDKCLLNLKRDDLLKRVMKNFHNITPPIMFDGLLIKMTRYLDAKKPIRKYMDRKIRDRVFQWHNLPLDIMCLSWSFSTTFSFFIALENEVQIKILHNMDIPSEYLNGFSLFVQNSINVRNLISHNMVLYGEDVKYQSAELNALYEHLHNDKIKDNVFRMPHLIKCVSKITCESPEDDLYIKTITAINNLKMSQAHKEKILKLYML